MNKTGKKSKKSGGKSGGHPKGRDSILTEYRDLSNEYDRKWSFYIEATHGATLARLHITGDERLLDVGCGTGKLLKRLSEKYPALRLAGIDPTPEMLSVARQRLAPHIQLEEAWAENLPFQDETFDVLVSCNVFHYITDPLAALNEAARVLKEGGLFVLTDWCHDFLTCRVCGLYLRCFNRAHFKTYRLKECREMLARAGFGRIGIERYKVSMLWGLMTAVSYKGAR
ncbi:MAG: hypothetical protein BMS9Abin23_0930 [Thermodesulfobacteriota bacterium]|nr:MAG: hypothetical protein BMS9Abin23_0930 [Thermodesulfobacteriota bacterium]